MTDRSIAIGLGSAIAVLCIWSGFIVFSRAGVLSGLTSYDVVAARFLVAGVLTIPFAWAWWPRNLSWTAIAIVALLGPGAIYTTLMFVGLAKASAAYGGVFANGGLPVFTMLLAFFIAGTRPGRSEVLATIVIILGGLMVAWRGLSAGGTDVAMGIVLFLIASVMIASYIYAIRHFSVTPKQALAVVNIPNALIYLPIWWFALPSTMSEAPQDMLLLQLAFQGLGPGFLAVMIFALMAFHLGPTPTAAVSAAVPATAALLAIPVLAEHPTSLEWFGIVTVTLGLALLIRRK